MKTTLAACMVLIIGAFASSAAVLQSFTPQLGGTLLTDFESFANGTLMDTQVGGVTFGQAPLAGRPQIDQFPWLFGYGASSGDHVLTGSTEGGYPFPTVAGIVATFAAPVAGVEIFFSDTSPIGDYTISAFGAGGVLLESFTVLAGAVLPPGYAGGNFPSPGTSPLPGLYVGFTRPTADIVSFQIGPSSTSGDAFAVDDLSILRAPGEVPEPGTFGLISLGIAGAWMLRRSRRA
jgi:PEP-CTERM motif-containing protein